ncbi:MAG: hypothetical protein JST92_19030 [Deltaproteobacteria bacterium]|nr:hypothetical protein [Deltaproteobacteria bacterium]
MSAMARGREGRAAGLRVLVSRAAVCALVALSGCKAYEPIDGTQALQDYEADAFWETPFPNPMRVLADGSIDVYRFPNPGNEPLVEKVRSLLQRDARGFGRTSAIFFPLTAPIGDLSRVVTLHSSGGVKVQAPAAFVLDLDAHNTLVDTVNEALADSGPFGERRPMAVLRPARGHPFAAGHLHAAVILRAALDANGSRLGVPLDLAKIVARVRPNGMSPEAFGDYDRVLTLLEAQGILRQDVAALTVFRTAPADPTMTQVRDAALAKGLLDGKPMTRRAQYEDYCVYGGTVRMPSFQSGVPPFADTGGGWRFDDQGAPIFQEYDEANLFVTVPRAPMPSGGWPVVQYIRAGGSGEVPLADRGPHATNGGGAPAGSGLATHFARAGYAGVQVDGPVGGLRNTTGGDEQFLVFNVLNPEALRDNLRQTAVELSLLARKLDSFTFDTHDCEGAAPSIRFDPTQRVLFGHSTGATIAPLALAIEDRFEATVLSGAGASFLENLLWKEKPLAVRPLAEALLGYTALHLSLGPSDPIVHFIQWAAEPADSQLIAQDAMGQKRHALVITGIVDRYILPPISQSLLIPLGVLPAGPQLDQHTAEEAIFPFQQDALRGAFTGELPLALPYTNAGGPVRVALQHAEDGIEDGHEVLFQEREPKRQMRCFLDSLRTGAPRVPAPDVNDGPCGP